MRGGRRQRPCTQGGAAQQLGVAGEEAEVGWVALRLGRLLLPHLVQAAEVELVGVTLAVHLGHDVLVVVVPGKQLGSHLPSY